MSYIINIRKLYGEQGMVHSPPTNVTQAEKKISHKTALLLALAKSIY